MTTQTPSLSLSLGLSVTTDYCIAHQLDPATQTDLTPPGSAKKPLRDCDTSLTPVWYQCDTSVRPQMIPSQSCLYYRIRTHWRMETWREHSAVSMSPLSRLGQTCSVNLFILPGVLQTSKLLPPRQGLTLEKYISSKFLSSNELLCKGRSVSWLCWIINRKN